METQIKTIIENYTLNALQVALISVLVSVVTFFITNILKNYFENKLALKKLETQHKFEQRKKIKEVIAKNKIHLINACETLNHRGWNFAINHNENWLDTNGRYDIEKDYFHSFVYRILVLFAWVKQTQKEMIYLDTTIATKEDLEFIKFLKIFPQIFCDLTFIEGPNANGNYAVDHFFRNNFELFPDVIIDNTGGVKSYAVFIGDLQITLNDLAPLYEFIDQLSPLENRKRWDRFHLFHLTTIIFLNNYGYDFQITNDEKLKKILTRPKKSAYLQNYFKLLDEYHISDNKVVKRLMSIANKIP
ncbi:hypothetical protein SD960_00750 [Flavobacterium sp. MMLR14_040]|uniref:hypothetical protein n=1 Tax=Flavobacterium sp. MMLR14_040 TaxID=3093843 RepID=UPI00298F6872|nr:hypothetical protein [Flavobacterium sp. MMLR14_040]MDW8848601.1 hypothetical protein [Flavobacterium sp. MMLR14_040]